MTDDELRLDVAAELFWDPKLNAEQVAVSAKNGTVTLRGTVGSFRQKREAAAAAQRVFGVIEVNDELQVRIPDSDRRGDAVLRGDVLQALMLDSLVPARTPLLQRAAGPRPAGHADRLAPAPAVRGNPSVPSP